MLHLHWLRTMSPSHNGSIVLMKCVECHFHIPKHGEQALLGKRNLAPPSGGWSMKVNSVAKVPCNSSTIACAVVLGDFSLFHLVYGRRPLTPTPKAAKRPGASVWHAMLLQVQLGAYPLQGLTKPGIRTGYLDSSGP